MVALIWAPVGGWAAMGLPLCFAPSGDLLCISAAAVGDGGSPVRDGGSPVGMGGGGDTLCLVSFCQSFTWDNPIVLPTTTHDDNLVLPAVLDQDGDPVKIGKEYIIETPIIEGGSVYLDNIGGHKCPNGALLHIPSLGLTGDGTPVKFILNDDLVLREMYAIHIMFSVRTSSCTSCVNQTVWKVGDEKDFLVTGGTVGNENTFFKIMKLEMEALPDLKNVYKLLYCPPQLVCKDVNGGFDNGYPRLQVIEDDPFPFVFVKAKDV
ncbi:hypothetical protein H5410_064547 [Solanum commersonii]|uniref:Uncharacterized protein n=1 Tax=Solanum commersonii TaxID=4109 RepID=A0A9J5VZ35_SOLCO|nr:hypothetical protein H5410_064547 [Solanum commersonii]